jgi:8-oxo-dGTP pyrophosphatase MutT (NUDIX family)
MRKTAGIFLIRKDNKLLIAHPTKLPENRWSIPKGGIEDGEYPTDAAVREMFEEANVDVSTWTLMHNLEHVKLKYKEEEKLLVPFVLFEKQNNIDFGSFEFKCNSNVPEEMGGFPEMDDFKWVTLDEAKEVLFKSQVKCVEEIERIIEKMAKASKKD